MRRMSEKPSIPYAVQIEVITDPPRKILHVKTADSDEAGQAFRQEAGHRFRFEAGRDSDLMSATWRLLPRIHAMMFCPEPLVKRAWFGCPQELEWRWVTADGARFPLRRSAARRYPRPCRAESRASQPSSARRFHGEDRRLRKLSPARSMR